MINRSRAAIRNDPRAASGLEKLVANIVGTGIKPKSEATNDVFRKDLQALFLDWSDQSMQMASWIFMGSNPWRCAPCWNSE